MIRIETSVSLASSPERVWEVLTDFAAFPDWNPLVLRVEGEPGLTGLIAARSRSAE